MMIILNLPWANSVNYSFDTDTLRHYDIEQKKKKQPLSLLGYI
jgi:hypothetical protein